MTEMMECVVHRTRHGDEAARCVHSTLGEDYRSLLMALETIASFDQLRAALPALSAERLAACLEDLEAIGLVEAVAMDWLVDLYLAASPHYRSGDLAV